MPSRRPPRAALAMMKVMSAPGTMLSARPASDEAEEDRPVRQQGDSRDLEHRLTLAWRAARQRCEEVDFSPPARPDARRLRSKGKRHGIGREAAGARCR